MRDSGKPILTSDQYSAESLRRYEWVFGKDFLSSGAQEMAKRAAQYFGIRPGFRVLDVGSGLGGAAFYFSGSCGATILGLDILPEMVAEARNRAETQGVTGVTFVCANVLTISIPAHSFDAVHSKDSFLHIRDKIGLARRLLQVLVPGGRLFFTDYLRGRARGSDEFESYAAGSAYELSTGEDYAASLLEAGFVDIEQVDWTGRLVEILWADIDRLRSAGPAKQELPQLDVDYLLERWQLKVRCLQSGDMRWASFSARKPPLVYE
ncbi:MAG: methyltransferase domain-containing protein [Candidatus Hydrogenedentes bacterium]|nr:methyltransferase domain-containing protein [Candidatus Hydrogenedentota bacterium]